MLLILGILNLDIVVISYNINIFISYCYVVIINDFSAVSITAFDACALS